MDLNYRGQSVILPLTTGKSIGPTGDLSPGVTMLCNTLIIPLSRQHSEDT